jgi:hypothetical protein
MEFEKYTERAKGGFCNRRRLGAAAARVNAQSLNRAIEEVRKGRKADSATAEEGYDALHTEAEAERHAAE